MLQIRSGRGGFPRLRTCFNLGSINFNSLGLFGPFWGRYMGHRV